MNLNYDKFRNGKGHHDSQWVSYSDLFTALSVVFLLLYVTASLRSGTGAVASQAELIAARKEAEETKKQLKVYEVLKEDYMKQEASKDDIAVYKEVMGKLSLLEDEAAQKRKDLYKQADEAKEKEQQLNKYQELVRSIVNANMLAQSKVKKRDMIIEEKATIIDHQSREMDDLNSGIRSQQAVIEQNSQKIVDIKDELTRKMREVEHAYKAGRQSKQKYEQRMAELKNQSEDQINALKGQNLQAANQLRDAQGKIEEKNREAERLLAQLGEKEGQYRKSIEDLKGQQAAEAARERAEFEEGLKKQALSAQAKIEQERAFAAAAAQKAAGYKQQLNGLEGQLAKTQTDMKGLHDKYQGSIASLNKANDALKKGLADSLEKLNAQKKLATQIAANLRAAGVGADVNPNTGDVIINFAGEYFDTGSSSLKPNMAKTLEKMMPAYAKSLFQNEKIAKKIGSVEIVGFASPTYKGKVIDPNSLRNEDRVAVNYNMDLSYQRAKSIFEHVFDPNKMQFEHQKELLPRVKVTGRSYLATEKIMGRNLSSSQNAGDYCAQYDCKKGQQVIIKFNLEGE